MSRRSAAVLAAVGGFVCGGAASGQTLLGDAVQFWGIPQISGISTLRGVASVTSPQHEFEIGLDMGAGFDLWATWNVEAMSLRHETLQEHYSPWFNTGFAPSSYEFRDLDFPGEPSRFIVGIVVQFSGIVIDGTAPAVFPEFSADQVTFTGDSVRVSYGGYRFLEGACLQIDLITAVPAPSGALALAGVGGLAAVRRRRAAVDKFVSQVDR